MKRIASILMLMVILTGCGVNNAELDRVMALRAKLLGASGCSFEAVVTADYGKTEYTCRIGCVSDGQGGVTFTVLEPESIEGITGSVSAEGGKLSYDGLALSFPLMADGQVTPVSAPWLLVRTLRGGYVKSCGMDGVRVRVAIDDSYESDALHLDIWLEDDRPVYAEILYGDRRILSMEVQNFQFL